MLPEVVGTAGASAHGGGFIAFIIMVAVNIEHLWRAQQALSQLCKVACGK